MMLPDDGAWRRCGSPVSYGMIGGAMVAWSPVTNGRAPKFPAGVADCLRQPEQPRVDAALVEEEVGADDDPNVVVAELRVIPETRVVEVEATEVVLVVEAVTCSGLGEGDEVVLIPVRLLECLGRDDEPVVPVVVDHARVEEGLRRIVEERVQRRGHDPRPVLLPVDGDPAVRHLDDVRVPDRGMRVRRPERVLGLSLADEVLLLRLGRDVDRRRYPLRPHRLRCASRPRRSRGRSSGGTPGPVDSPARTRPRYRRPRTRPGAPSWSRGKSPGRPCSWPGRHLPDYPRRGARPPLRSGLQAPPAAATLCVSTCFPPPCSSGPPPSVRGDHGSQPD